MKIYNEIVFDIDGNVIYEDSFEYSGDVMLLQGPNREEHPYLFEPLVNEMGEPTGFKLRDQSDPSWDIYRAETQDIDLSTQTQAGDVQANAAPSLPSISNVGSVSPTGVVNTQAIPGGFQPLPQTAGTEKKLYQLSQFHGGVNHKSSPRDIADSECQKSNGVSFADIGRIKLLGLCTNTDNSITTGAASITDRGRSGYGLFQFVAPADTSNNAGETVITLTPDGGTLDAHNVISASQTNVDGWISSLGSDNSSAAHVIYAAGNGVYACNSTLAESPQAKIYVYREDAAATPGDQTVSGWKEGKSLIDSPLYDSDASAQMVAGTVKCRNDLFTISVAGCMGASCVPSGSAAGWGTSGATDYYFYVSWLFDGGCETGLTSFGSDGGDDEVSDGISFNGQLLTLNVSLKHTPHASNNTELGADKRIEGARIYFKEEGTAERWLLAEFNMIDGVKGALDSTYRPWAEASDVYSHTGIIFENPPEVYSYASLNGYYANEVYTPSPDESFRDATCDYSNDPTIAMDSTAKLKVGMYVYDIDGSGDIPAGATVDSITDATHFELSTATINGGHTDQTLHFVESPTAISLRYKTCVVGQNGTVFIGNVNFDGKHMPDSMMFSMPGKPGVFPKFNVFDSPSSDGSPIRALAAFQDTILQFKENALYVINVSNPAQFYSQKVFRDCGVYEPCQVFTTSFGVIFANKHGCFIYDGQKVISLTGGKFTTVAWGIAENHQHVTGDTANVPCVGYDPRSQNIIVLKDIGHNGSNSNDAHVYNMITQSWSGGANMIVNADNVNFSNFIITSGGYLSILNHDETALHNYNHIAATSQSVDYQTKDLDFGLPSQTKKIFKVYVTYTSGSSNVPTATFGVDGGALTTSFSSGSFSTSQTNSVATFVPTSAATGCKSFALKITGTLHQDFQLSDISILYRVRPIK